MAEEMIKKATDDGCEIVWDRFKKQQPQCRFGKQGVCCRLCNMGPCSIGKKTTRGVCGATAETIAARNFARMVAGGSAAHSDHAREVALTLIKAAKGEIQGYGVKDEKKLLMAAAWFGIPTDKKEPNQLALEIGTKALGNFTQQEGELDFIRRAPTKRQEKWRELGVVPRGVDREIVEIMHRTNMGVDQDMENIMLQAARCSLADGWGGSMIATELQDILFRTPKPLKSQANLGILDKEKVNILVHGHEPLLSEMIVQAAEDPELIKMAQEKGAKGINLGGICCTANEILMRHGIPLAGSFMYQEIAIATGVVDAMIVDVQCVMQALPEVARCYHTKIITTSEKAKIPGAIHIQFNEHKALDVAKEIIKAAIENYPNRTNKILIPDEKTDIVAGFSHEYINYMQGGSFRASYRPLNDAIIDGRIKGVVGVVGCTHPNMSPHSFHLPLVQELIANDVLVVQTGCGAVEAATKGLLTPNMANEAGPGLAEVCETIGCPPVLHAGSCVDNSRILIAVTAMVNEGGLGDDISTLPVAGVAPEWMSEKAIAIGQYFVSSGVFTIFGGSLPVTGSEEFSNLLFKKFEDIYGGMWATEEDPIKIAQMCIKHIEKKRDALGITSKRERVLYDMEARRQLEAE